ncbi:MAG: hypothetical protein HZB80_01840 [Deltaproteobacteria bacterium]|nr:hypothetical protein [Deltaproteobacteria bacterium]
MFCPICKSKRLRRYSGETKYYCPACKKGFSIVDFNIPVCFKCGKAIDDALRAVELGNGKTKHLRCRKLPEEGEDNMSKRKFNITGILAHSTKPKKHTGFQ